MWCLRKKQLLLRLAFLLVWSSIPPSSTGMAETVVVESEGNGKESENVAGDNPELHSEVTIDEDHAQNVGEPDGKNGETAYEGEQEVKPEKVEEEESSADGPDEKNEQESPVQEKSVEHEAGVASHPFAYGNGSAGAPFIIETAEQLNEVRGNMSAHFQLGNDIDLAAYSSGQGWVPIGVSFNQFNGTFDGNGYVIKNVSIDRSNTRQDDQGLFGVLGEEGVIKDVSLKDIDISSNQGFSIGGLVGLNYGEISGVNINGTVEGRYYVGGVVGRNHGDVSNSYAEGRIHGESRVGGLIGETYGDVTRSSTESHVSGESYIGGLVGLNLSTGNGISQSFAKSTVNGNQDVGGLVGQNQNTIFQSYAEGTVEGNRNIGGLIGNQSWSDIKKVSESYSNSLVTGNDNIGGLVGLKHDVATIEASYWNTSVQGGDSLDNGVGTPMTEAQLKQFSSYNDWDFINSWYVYNGQTFPFLQWENPLEKVEVDIDSSELKMGDSAQISVTANHKLGSFDGKSNAQYSVTEGEQVVDVSDAGVVTAKENGEAVITIILHGEENTLNVKVEDIFEGGDGSAENPYIITTPEQLDTVRENLDAHYKLAADIDLSTYLSGESWEPLGDDQLPFEGTFNGEGYEIKGLKINGMLNVQGLFGGLGNTGVIKNVTLVDVEIEGDSIIGGLVAYSYPSARIENSTVTGTLSGNSNVGGLVGMNYGMIRESAAHTTIQLSNINGGGLAGINYGSIIKSYARGEISGRNSIGGLVGGYFLGRDENSKLSESYSSSIVTGEENVGGLVGLLTNDSAIIEHSYWNKSKYDGDYPDNGYGTPITEAELKHLSTFTNWDFTSTWYVYNDQVFPFLQWENSLEAIEVNLDFSTLEIGDSTPITVTAHHEEGSFDGTSNAEYEVTEGNHAVDVNQKGEVIAKAPGKAVITATLYGEVKMVEVTVDSNAISAVKPLDSLHVSNGTAIDELDLPNEVEVTLRNGDTLNVTVTWDKGEPEYDGTRAGVYLFIGTLELPAGVRNPEDLKAKVAVNVGEPGIIEVGRIDQIEVSHGTAVSELDLPGQVEVTLTNGETMIVSIRWDKGEPEYDGTKAGVYHFTGTLELPAGVRNPNQLEAVIHVLVLKEIVIHTVQFQSNGGSEVEPVKVADGLLLEAPSPPVRSGYTFAGWYQNEKLDQVWDFKTNPVTANLTLYAKWSRNSSSGGSGGKGSGRDRSDNTYFVDINGRTIVFSSGQIVIPRRAWNRSFTLKIDEVNDTSRLPFTEKEQLVSKVISFTKNLKGTFQKAVTITLQFNTDLITQEEYVVSLYWFNEETGQWVELENIEVDWKNGTVSGTIDHFTKFAVIANEIEDELVEVPEETEPKLDFHDLHRHWAKESVQQLIKSGAINGYPDGTFKPNQLITRAEFVSILVHALNLEEMDGLLFFDTRDHWAKDVIATAHAHGIVNGYTETIFGANDPITREQIAVMITRATGLSMENETLPFVDQGKISTWAQDAVMTLTERGIIEGFPDGSFQPQKGATRAETAVLLSRTLESIGSN